MKKVKLYSNISWAGLKVTVRQVTGKADYTVYKITSVMKVETDIISCIVASPIGTSWDTSDNVCQSLKTEVIIFIDIIIICLMSLTNHFKFVDTDNIIHTS